MAMFATKINSGVSSSIGSPGGAVTSITKRLKCQEEIRIGTWNVKTMRQEGKIQNAIQEMTQMNINIMGVSEMRWPGAGSANIEEHQVYYSGTDNGKHELGVGIIMTKEMSKSVDNFIPVSARVMLIQLKARPIDINIIQIYAPTTEGTEEEVEELYNSINQVMKKLKKQDITIVMGDFNAKVGAGRTSSAVGPFGLGSRNDRGDTLEIFAESNQLVIMNTWFKLHQRKLYTWKSPMDAPERIVRNQIDYILVSKRYRNSCTCVKTYPGADIQSDHVPVVGKFKVKMKRVTTKNFKRYDLKKLKDPIIHRTVKNTLNEQMEKCRNAESIEEELTIVQEISKEIKEQHLKKDTEKRKSWMTNEILELMKHRKRNINNTQEYKRIQTIIRRKIREAKEKEKKNQCEEIEFYQSRYDDFNVHRKVREVTGRTRKNICGKLVDENGSIIINKEEKKETWKKYLENLFDDVRNEQEPVGTDTSGPEIMKEEVEIAIKQLKEGKAAGLDQIPAEIIKLFDEKSIERIIKIFNFIHRTGKIPKEWLKSEFITLPKKSNAKTCEDHRTISLMSHLLKTFLKIIHRRIYKICEEQISPNQFGFLNAVGTREALFSVQVLVQRCRDVNCNFFVCLIDYKKAFDRVKHDKMIEVLTKTGIDTKDLKIITNLYWNQTAVLRTDGEHTEEVKILRGVRQGCILSPILFNLYSEHIFREALDDMEEGITINGTKLNNLRYADDTLVFADSIQSLQKLMNKITEVSSSYGLDINASKTKVMVISKTPIDNTEYITVNGDRIERVKQCQYLGTCINETWENSQEIRCRIAKARSTFNSMGSVFKSHNLTLDTKMRLLKCYVFSVLLYGVETWTLTQDTTKKLEAFELWLYRRILRLSWTHKVTNKEVLQRMKKEPEIINTVKKRKLQYLGHIMRNEHRYQLLQQILQGKIAGRRPPGRRRISWLANLRTWFNKSSAQLFRIATNKVRIAVMIANLRNAEAP
uniref:Craniofacial development protein 2 n=1 Tax=Cacopsylla melanoneura TaxID=428564 RepID=A0A8D8T8A4_9HEMI